MTAETDFDFGAMPDDEVTVSEEPVKGTRRMSQAGGKRRGRKPGTARLTGLQKQLSTELFTAGTMVGMMLPVTGIYVCEQADAFTKSVVQLASSRPEWISALENLAQLEPGLIIGRTVFGIGAAIMVDRGRIEPDRQILKLLGVYSAWRRLEANQSGDRTDASFTAGDPPAGAFIPVA